MYLLVQIIVSALAVLGFYFMLKVIVGRLFSGRYIATAVIVERHEQLESLDIMISEALSAVVFSRGRRVAVIVPRELLDACSQSERKKITEIADDFGAEIYIF
ncbi:MAG: hypothetical protein IJV87_01885 [Clostridia bacterium]|nr:hypothetical protein [Clostridia bacterium]